MVLLNCFLHQRAVFVSSLNMFIKFVSFVVLFGTLCSMMIIHLLSTNQSGTISQPKLQSQQAWKVWSKSKQYEQFIHEQQQPSIAKTVLRVVNFPANYIMNRQNTPPGACNNTKDPEPTGGAPCTKDLECGGAGSLAVCDFNNGNGTCVCPPNRGKPDCSYVRIDKDLVGGLNIGLPFAGLNGIGDLVAKRNWQGALQLVFGLCGGILICIMASICGGFGAFIACCLALAGFIWSIASGAVALNCGHSDGLGYAFAY